MIKRDILGKQAKFSFLGIGSNLGDRKKNIEIAKNLLNNNKIYIEDSSNYYETPSWPNNKFPKFYNIVVKISSDLTLVALFKTIKQIESTFGKRSPKKNYPRKCDIDIIDFRGLNLKSQFNGQNIVVPHSRMQTRNFVIFPLYELNKSWIHPKTKININSLIYQFKNSDFSDIRIV